MPYSYFLAKVKKARCLFCISSQFALFYLGVSGSSAPLSLFQPHPWRIRPIRPIRLILSFQIPLTFLCFTEASPHGEVWWGFSSQLVNILVFLLNGKPAYRVAVDVQPAPTAHDEVFVRRAANPWHPASLNSTDEHPVHHVPAAPQP